MEVRVTPAIEQIIPPQISFNFEEIRAELAQKLQVYQNMVVTESGVKEAKADRANLNKFKAALADSRKSVKSQWNQPLSDFEDKMKVLEQMVDEPISVIDRQIKSFEEIKKEEKRQSIEAFFEDNVGDLEEILPLQKIWNERWLNATYPMKEIEQEIISRMRKTHNDINIIVAMQQAMPENERTKQQAEETEKVKVLDFRVWVTPEQMQALKAFLLQNHIRYGRVE